MEKQRLNFRFGKTDISVIEGDISQVKSDALITAINSDRMWFGGIDRVIQNCAGNMFHGQAEKAAPLHDCQTVVAKRLRTHSGHFDDVIFVVDDLERPLGEIITAALIAAERAGYSNISLPAIRTGIMLGKVEKTAEEAVLELLNGLKTFIRAHTSTSIKQITFVIFRQPDIYQMLSSALKKVQDK